MDQSTSSPPGAPAFGTYTTLFRLVGANMNSTADQQFERVGGFAKFIIKEILVTEASGALSGAIGGIYTATAKGGVAVVAAAQTYAAITAADSVLNLTLASPATRLRTDNALYLSLTTALGLAGTASIFVMGIPG